MLISFLKLSTEHRSPGGHEQGRSRLVMDALVSVIEEGIHMRRLSALWRRRRDGRDRGMSTAEYAVGTVAAAAFAGLLFKIVTSPEVRKMLLEIIHRALSLVG